MTHDFQDSFVRPSTDSYDFREKYMHTLDGLREYNVLREAMRPKLLVFCPCRGHMRIRRMFWGWIRR